MAYEARYKEEKKEKSRKNKLQMACQDLEGECSVDPRWWQDGDSLTAVGQYGPERRGGGGVQC